MCLLANHKGVNQKLKKEFLKFCEDETVSSRIELSKKDFRKVEAMLKPLGITFRSPDR